MIAIFFLIVAIGVLIIVSWIAWYYYEQSEHFEKICYYRMDDIIKLRDENSLLKSKVEHYSKLSSERFYETIDLEEKIRTLTKEHESAIHNCNQENARQYEYIKKLQSDLHTLRSDVADRDKEIEEIINRYKIRYNTNTAAYKSFSSY